MMKKEYILKDWKENKYLHKNYTNHTCTTHTLIVILFEWLHFPNEVQVAPIMPTQLWDLHLRSIIFKTFIKVSYKET